MLNKNLFTLLSYLLLTGCGMIDYHPYDVRISGETDVNAHNIEQIEADCKGKKTIRFVTMGDSQRWYDETEATGYYERIECSLCNPHRKP